MHQIAPKPNREASDLRDADGPDFIPLITLVLWLVGLSVGTLGLRLGYPPAAAHVEAPVIAPTRLVEVEIAPTPPPQPEVLMPPPEVGAPSPEPSPAPAAPPPMAVPESPPVTAVAAPSPAIAFALPVEGLTRLVDVSRAEHTRPALNSAIAGTSRSNGSGSGAPGPVRTSAAPATAQPAIQHLTLGEGEGRQPVPEYPRAAVLAHEEGEVRLRFTVSEDGSVQSVEVVSAARWPVLNQAASRTVHERWRFSAGPRRIYEVSIQFELNSK